MTTFPPAEPRDGIEAGELAGRDRAYAAARRHSARVRFLKRAIPVGALVVGAAVLGAAYLNPLGRLPGLTLGPVSLTGTKIAMESPKLTGFRKDARAYEVTAKAAYQDVRRPGIIELKDLKGKLALDDTGQAAELAAALGIFDTAREHLELREDIRVSTSRGEEVLLRSAAVDFKAGTVTSREPVKLTSRGGTIEAEGVEVTDGGRTLAFTGRVRTVFLRPLPEPTTTASPERRPTPPPPRISQAEPGPAAR